MKTAGFALLICSLGLLSGMNVPDVGLQDGVRVGMSNQMGHRGNVSVDTFTWVFTIRDTLDYNEASPPSGDEAAYLAYNAAVLAADSVISLEDIDGFAYANLDQADQNDYNSMHSHEARFNVGPSETWDTDLSASTNDRYLHVARVPWENLLPFRAEILEANWHLVPRFNAAIDNSDSLIVTLMTSEADTAWYQYLGNKSITHASQASWLWQRTTSASTGEFAWNPTLDNRDTWMDWGDVSDWNGGSASDFRIDANAHWPVKIRNCVQAAVNGTTNNGMMLFCLENTGGVALRTMYHPETTFNRPYWFEVTFTTRTYSPPFAGKEWAFVFSTDDGLEAANDTFRSVYSNFSGARYTLYVSGEHEGVFWDTDNIATWDTDEFVEIGLHGKYHDVPSGGLRQWGATGGIPAGVPESGNAAWDSLIIDSGPDWLLDKMIAHDGLDRSSARYFAKTLAFPGQIYDGSILLALDYHGLSGWRTGEAAVATEDGQRVLRRNPYFTAADTAFAGITRLHALQAPRNLDLVPLTTELENLVGDTTSVVSAAALKEETRRTIRSLLAQDRRALIFYTHDLKKSASGSLNIYTYGIEGSELRAMMEQADDEGAAFLSVTDYVSALKGRANAVKTPDAYGQDAEFKWTAAQQRYWTPLYPGRK